MNQDKYLIGTLDKSQLGTRLDKALANLFSNYSRSKIKHWILNGSVKVNGQIILVPRRKMFGGENISIKFSFKEEYFLEGQKIPLNIIYEDDDIIIINKPRDLVIHPGNGNNNGTLLNALLYYYPNILNIPRAGIVHRLDKNTTGLMVVAKTIIAYTNLVQLLQERKITREYEAIVIGIITSSGTIDQPIGRNPNKRIKMSVQQSGKPSVTHYSIIEYFRAHTHIRIQLCTGRTHQIRVHMSHIDHLIVGDQLYGKGNSYRIPPNTSEVLRKKILNFDRQALHSILLRFRHPITLTEMEWIAPYPKDMEELILALKYDVKLFKNI